jgi:hypothetical protein
MQCVGRYAGFDLPSRAAKDGQKGPVLTSAHDLDGPPGAAGDDRQGVGIHVQLAERVASPAGELELELDLAHVPAILSESQPDSSLRSPAGG